MAPPHASTLLPLDLKVARDAAVDLAQYLFEIVEAFRGRGPNPNRNPTLEQRQSIAAEIDQLIREAERSVAPVEGELLKASRSEHSAIRVLIEFGRRFSQSLAALKEDVRIDTQWVPFAIIPVHEFMKGIEGNRLLSKTPEAGIDFEVRRAASLRLHHSGMPAVTREAKAGGNNTPAAGGTGHGEEENGSPDGARGSEEGKPGVVFKELLNVIDEAGLSKMEAKVVRVIAERNGSVPIVDANTLCDCDALSAFKRAKPKLRKCGWHLRQHHSELRAEPLKKRVRN